MKTKQITIKVLQFENGDILLAKPYNLYYIKNKYGIVAYNAAEMKQIYNYIES